MRRALLCLGIGAIVSCAIDSRNPSVSSQTGGAAGATGTNLMVGQGSILPDPGSPAVDTPQCEEGQYQCKGASLQICADDLRGWVTLERCAGAALCQVEPPSCLAPICSAGEMSCVGAVLQRCNADRSGWDLFARCASPAQCNPDRRQCLPAPCTPGERRCDRDDTDQSPTLETCRSDQQGWDSLASCITPELCNQAIHPSAGSVVVGSDGVAQLGPAPSDQVVACALPACAAGELRCDGARLQLCSDTRAGFELAEECATPALCQASTTNLSASGKAACLAPACAANEHRCTEAGVLQVCNEDRTGFRVIQSCIGPAYCNATLADQGQEGCRPTPCAAGQTQCNRAQIQVCRADRSGLDDSGTACESARLCNSSDPTHAVCDPPACHRGPGASDEFRCAGAALERCNESLTGYDTIDNCATAELCDPSQRFQGCQAPSCSPGDHECKGSVLQTCKDDRSGFEDGSDCGSPAACDANAGQCTTPCQPGTMRCNSRTGDLEQCGELETGWQAVADCLSPALCDLANRRCNPPLCAPGERRCETRDGNADIVECAPGRETFNVSRTCAPGQICDAQNNECDVCTPNSVRCDGDTLISCDARGQSETRETCGAGLCSAEARRCLACGPIGSARCTNQQLLVCTQSPQGEFESSEFCETDALCAQTLDTCGAGLTGLDCQCNPGTCRANQLKCNGADLQRCNAGLTGYDTIASCDAPELCNQATGDCNPCVANQYSCEGGQLRQCANDGRSFARENISLECASASQLRVCSGGAADVQNCPNGCTNGRGCNQCSGSGVQCVNGTTLRRCVDGFFQDQACQFGCNAGSSQCNACQGNGSACISNSTLQACVNGQFSNSNCPMGCLQGRCANCTTAQCVNGNQRRDCVGGQLQNAINCSDGNACNGNEGCFNGSCTAGSAPNCNDNNACTDDFCSPAVGCQHSNNTVSCSDGDPCNGTETCGGGRCNPGRALCPNDDPNTCTEFFCDPGSGTCSGLSKQNCCTGPTCDAAGGFFDCVNNTPTFVVFCSEAGLNCVPDRNIMCAAP